MRQCVFVIGTRAQIVKIAPVLREACRSKLPHVVWFTSQHHESIDDLIDDFSIRSEFVRPGAARERSSILRLLSWLPGTLLRCRRYVRDVRDRTRLKPLVVVHGDTLSTLLGAIAARTGGGEVVHLESGLSSGRLLDPFPEEILRRLTFRLSRYALCPNDEAFAQMQRRSAISVVHTGENTLLDCVRYALREGPQPQNGGDYFVASIHRFQNIYRRSTLAAIVDELLALAGEGIVYFILHPATRNRLESAGLYARLGEAPGVELRPRMPYTAFLKLLAGARGVVSDGGSNQEELSYLGVPTVLFRERSERPDGLGGNVIFRHDVDGTLADFARAGGFADLRRPSRLDADVEPSRLTVAALQNWAQVAA